MIALVIIAAFSSLQNDYLLKSLENYLHICEGGFTLKIIVQTVDMWSPASISSMVNSLYCTRIQSNLDVEIQRYDKTITKNLTAMHREVVESQLFNYDLFIYQEDDMSLDLKHIEYFIHHTEFLETSSLAATGKVPMVGFLRYEILQGPTLYVNGDINFETADGGRFIIENPLPQFSLRCIDGKPFVLDYLNPHQAFWIMTRNQVIRLRDSCNFFKQPDIELNEFRGKQVYMSSFSIFKADPRVLALCGLQQNISCDIEKVIPLDGFLHFAGVHHMRQRYAADFPVLTIDHLYQDMLTFALSESAQAAGDVPACWREVAKRHKLSTEAA